ncbi:MAG: hypothetical protein LBD63_00315 [Mycoplasmataceae bacterium]|jgi:phosphotransferase system IIB component|nr:hypothetical protein [Mycoplasmataceae bacterium]
MLGIPYLYAKHKAKQISNVSNTKLQVSTKFNFDINLLIDTLGGKENIISSSATMSTLKINLKSAQILTKESFSKFKINGFMKNNNQIILVFGDNAQAINDALILNACQDHTLEK